MSHLPADKGLAIKVVAHDLVWPPLGKSGCTWLPGYVEVQSLTTMIFPTERTILSLICCMECQMWWSNNGGIYCA